MYELLFKNIAVLDETGKDAFVADIGIKAEKSPASGKGFPEEKKLLMGRV